MVAILQGYRRKTIEPRMIIDGKIKMTNTRLDKICVHFVQYGKYKCSYIELEAGQVLKSEVGALVEIEPS